MCTLPFPARQLKHRTHLSATEEPTLYAAISGLGETGRVEDAGLIVPYTSHHAARIRRAAVKAIATLDPEATPEQLGRLRESLEKCGHLIDEPARQQLWFLAKA